MSGRLKTFPLSSNKKSETDLPAVEIYFDGAARPTNPGPAGAGCVIFEIVDGKREMHAFGKYIGAHETNNRAEISAAILGLNTLTQQSRVTMYGDSTYVIRTMNGEYFKGKNRDLWAELDAVTARHVVDWQWTRGHAGDEHNELADQLASLAADEQRDVTEDDLPEQLQADGETLTTLEDLLARALSGSGLLTLGAEDGLAFAVFQQPDGETVNWRSRGVVDLQHPSRSYFERNSLEDS